MFYRIAVVALFGVALFGCGTLHINVTRGSGKVITETRSVSNFHGVTLSGFGELNVTQDGTEALTIQAEDNLMPLITTQVQDGLLVIGMEPGINVTSVLPTQPVKYDLHVKNLDSIQLSGAGNIVVPSLQADSLNLLASGAGNISLNQFENKQLNATLSGAGNLSVAGQGDAQAVTVTGLGSYDGGNFKTNTAVVTISGAGSATVWATQSLTGNIGGAGSISYYGDPQVSQAVSGVGSIKKLGSK
jgi:hypothetical protein